MTNIVSSARPRSPIARVSDRGRHRVCRAGRVLVECCVALVLLAVSSTLVLLGATGTATLVDAAIQEDRVQRAQAQIAARVQQDACANGASLPAATWGPRLSVDEAHVATDSLHLVHVLANWDASALAGFAGRSVAVSTAGVCE